MKFFILGTKTPEDSQDTLITTLMYNYGLGGEFESYWVTGYEYVEELSNESNKIYKAIKDSNPQVIIALGTAVAEFLLGNRFVSLNKQSGKLMKCKVEGQSYQMIVTYSANYASKSEEIKSKLIEDLLQAIKYASEDFKDFSSKRLEVALSYREFEDYINRELADKELISYDIETNAQPVHSEWFKTIGFSLSGNENSGVYVVREALEQKISDEDWKLITNKLVEILKTHRIIVHNSMYEVPAAVNEYGYRLENWEDTLAMARLLLGGQTGAGLKEQCQQNLGYPEWEEDLTIYRGAMDKLRNLFKPTESGAERSEFTKLKEFDGNLIRLMEECKADVTGYLDALKLRIELPDDDKNKITKDEYIELSNKALKRRDAQIALAIKDIYELILDYYDDIDEYPPFILMRLVGKELINLVESSEYGFLPYSSIPLKILSKYGAIDAVGTFELYDKLSDRINKESTKDVDLWKGYSVIKAQLEVATSMEMAGLYWDDKVAQGEQDWFNAHACEAMRNMLLSGFLDNNIFQNCRSWWIDYLIENNKDELVEQLGFDYVLTDLGIKKFEDGQVKGREIRRYKIQEYISEEYWNSVKDILIRYAKIQILDETKFKYFDEYKEIYNPASPGQFKVLNPILVTDDIKLAAVLQSVYLILDDANRDTDKEFQLPDRKLFSTLRNFRTMNKEISDWNEENPDDKKPKITNQEIFQVFKSMIETTQFRSSELNRLIMNGLKYELTSGDEPSLIEIYHLYQLLGFDIEDESTWNESFRFLYNFRMYKKCIKMITSYITGSKLGRGMVTIVNDDELMEPMPVRRDWYSEDHPKTEDQSYIMESSFGPCTANTLRWRCIHPDTIIPLMDGTLPKVKDLVGLDEFWVYSYDKNSKRIVPGHAHHARVSNDDADIYEIFLDNGKSFKATGNHPILTRLGNYVNVEDLEVGTSLMPLYRRDSYKHGLAPGGYEEIYYPELDEWELTMYSSIREYLGVEPDNGNGYQVHHSNYKKTDNTPTNLEFLTESEHLKKHQGWSHHWDNPEFREMKTEKSRIQMINQNLDKAYQDKCQEGRRRFFEDPEKSKSFREMASKNGHNTWYRRFDTAYDKAKSICKQFGRINEEIYMSNKYERDLRWGTMCERLGISSEDLAKKIESEVFYNCKVVRIEYVGKSEVYDITVDKYHNFAISLVHGVEDKVWSGIFTHNSGYHTIPSTSSIKNIYTSRYQGGTIFAPDYSQNEVRAIAAVSKCEPLIQAFRDGIDIHRFNACFTGDTKVWLTDGTHPTFKELCERYPDPEERFWVYSIDSNDNIIMGKAYNPRKTKISDDLVEVELDNGSKIRCTENHLWRTRNNGYVRAQDLVPGVSIASLYIKDYIQLSQISDCEVILVRRLDIQEEEVYDLSVEEYDNFAIDVSTETCQTAVFVHNSKIWKKDINEVTSVERRYAKMSCLVGSTKIKLLGEVKTIQEMYESGFRSWKTFSYNLKTNLINCGISNDIQLTKYVSNTVMVVFNQGGAIECTPDHPLLTIDGTYVQAQESIGKIIQCLGLLNIKVVDIIPIHYDKEIPVYDLSIPEYHNYAVYLNKDISIFVHNTFSLLYGDTPEGFATKFLAGDVALGRQIFHDFYEAYPEIHKWTMDRYKEWRDTGKVSLTLTGMFLKISDEEFFGDEAKADRASGNYPIQSFDFSTKIKTLSGKDRMIGELAENHEDVWVYARDPETQEIKIVKGVNAQCTGTTDTWYKLTFDNGEYVKVTPEHKMMLRDGTFVRADQLQIGQSMMPYYNRVDESNVYNGYLYIEELGYAHRESHRQTYPYIDISKGHLHHIDMNKLNNSPENIILLSNSWHTWLHRVSYEYAGSNDPQFLQEIIDQISIPIKEIYHEEDASQKIEAINQFLLSIDKDKFEKSMTYRNQMRSLLYLEWDQNQKEAVSQEVYRRYEETGSVLGVSHEEASEISKRNWVKYRDTNLEALRKGHNKPESREAHSKATKRQFNDPQMYYNNQIGDLVWEMCKLNLPYSTPEEYDQSVVKLVENAARKRRYSSTILSHMAWDQFLKFSQEMTSKWNHKLVKIEIIYLDKPEKKYDLHVPGYENFALACGVFTHNSQSSNIAGYVLASVDRFLRQNNMLTRPVLFIHDSLEFDVYPKELLFLSKKVIDMMLDIPNKDFEFLAKVDLELGVSLGQGLEATKVEMNEDHTEGSMIIEGKLSNFEPLLQQWKLIYREVDYEYLEEPEKIYVPRGDLFVPKLTLSKNFGTYEQMIKAKVHIKY